MLTRKRISLPPWGGRALLPGLLAACLLVPAGPAAAQSRNTKAQAEKPAARSVTNDAEAIELLRAIEARHGSVQTVAGRFLQTRQIVDSPDSIKEAANFHLVKPNKFRADYTRPGEASDPRARYPYITTSLIVGRDYWQYVRDINQINHYRFSNERNVRDFNYLLLGFGAHTEELLKVYQVKSLKKAPKGYRAVQLTPLDPSDAGFKSITMLVTDDEALLPAQFSMVQVDETRVTVDLDLKSLQIGARINERIFRPDFPKDAERVELN